MTNPVHLRILSLGAGVQSSTIAIMMARGDLPAADAAIFADTGAEPAKVYQHLHWLIPQLPFPVHIVSAGNLRQEILDAAAGKLGAHGRPPFFVRNRDGSAGIIRRQCTGDYKIDPIIKQLRAMLGVRPRCRVPANAKVTQIIGISRDEVHRVKQPRQAWITNEYPLIDLNMRRHDCLTYLERRQYPRPPRSACTFCPFRSDLEWRLLRDEAPPDFDDAVMIDRVIRRGVRGLKADGVYLHRSLVPLDEVDLSNAVERGQPDLFGNECEGMCGL